MTTTVYLYGRIGTLWHALRRHDPQYFVEQRESARLTALARKKDQNAKPITVARVVDQRPGFGTTLCGLMKRQLDELGVDPAAGDTLCQTCEEIAKQ